MSDGAAAQASAYLRMLLLRPGEYRGRWERLAARPAAGEIDAAAVGQVLAGGSRRSGHARDLEGREPEGRDLEDREFECLARGALDGALINPDVLQMFVDAFVLDGRDASRLRDLLRGTDSVRVINGGTPATFDERLGRVPRHHDTIALHELHVLGPDGSPAEHQTIQVIRSKVDGLERYPYRFDTDELAVEVIRGGRVGERIYRVSDSLYAVDIVLAKPLAAGETTLTQVRTTFRYENPPAPEFRRGVLRRTEDVTLWVKFHPRRLPSRVWLATWDGIDHARVVEQQQVELDDDLSAHGRFGPIESAVVGFYWEWDDDR